MKSIHQSLCILALAALWPLSAAAADPHPKAAVFANILDGTVGNSQPSATSEESGRRSKQFPDSISVRACRIWPAPGSLIASCHGRSAL